MPDSETLPPVVLISNPPAGKCKIVNFYYDPDEKKIIWQYDDEPIGG